MHDKFCSSTMFPSVYSMHSFPAGTDVTAVLQPQMEDLRTDERGSFAVYGPATFVVSYVRSQCSFYELCEAVWGHWMRWQHQNPACDSNAVFYWIDLFALPYANLSKPLSTAAEGGALEKVSLCLLLQRVVPNLFQPICTPYFHSTRGCLNPRSCSSCVKYDRP
jgi:hypothetical protein